jgi:hypothetical protein
VRLPLIKVYYSNFRRTKKAVVNLLFFLLILPTIFTASSLLVDYSNIILAHREASDVADSVVNAAVTSYELDSNGFPTGNIDYNQAKNSAYGIFDTAVSFGAIKESYNPELEPTISISPDRKSIKIKINFAVKPFFLSLIDFGSSDIYVNGSVIREATICNSDLNQVCANPL